MTDAELAAYQQNGYVLFENAFSREEIAALTAELPALMADESPRRVLERDGRTVRSLHGSHEINDTFDTMTRLSRMLRRAERAVGSQVYVHQFKINVKAAFDGEVWKWHQDFIFWLKQDGMQEARCVNAFVFLDDVTDFNGPLFVVPGSHRDGMIDVSSGADTKDWTTSFSADLKFAIPREVLEAQVKVRGMKSITGRAGSLLFTDPNLLHCSPPNMSPSNRALAIVTYNSVENALLPVPQPRPEFLVSRTFTPLTAVSDTALRDSLRAETA
jgi:ectoine hydroxylase-related dioxygenase (phytanoyl-CoA dioxygenase family)